MGVLLFTVDDQHRRISSEFTRQDMHWLWSFTWVGIEMRGTLKQLPGGEVIRNIALQKE